MPRENQVWFSVAKTINIGNYESCRVELGESVDSGEDSNETMEQLKRTIYKRFNKSVKEIEKIIESQRES